MQGAFHLLVAALLGVAAGYGSIFFRWLIALVSTTAFPQGDTLAALHVASPFRVLLAPALGGLVVGPLVYWLAREARGHGVPEVKDAVANRGGRIRKRVALVKVLASGITIGSGGSVGREGPIVQIGSAIGSALGQALGLPAYHLRTFVASGAAGGIAATFNAPIAGVIFAVEVILGRASARHFGALIVASVVATMVARHHLGNQPAFLTPSYALMSAWELPLYVLLGALAAGVGVAFTRGLYALEDLWNRFPVPPYLHAMFGGAVVGVMAIRLPQVLGNGYETIEHVLHDISHHIPLSELPAAGFLLLLVAVKLIATGTTIGSGGSGGVFAPSLFLGSCLGGAFGRVVNMLMPPGMVASPGAYGLVAMGALVAATTHAPLTAIIIVFELTDGHSIILPLMLSCTLSTVIAMRLLRESIYTLKLVRRGAHLGTGQRAEIMTTTAVRSLMQPVHDTLQRDSPLLSVVELHAEMDHAKLYVTDEGGRLLGVLSADDVAMHLRSSVDLVRPPQASDLMQAPHCPVRPQDMLDRAMELITRHNRDELPVVDEGGRLLGRVTRADLMRFFTREVVRTEAVLAFEGDDEQSREVLKLATGEIRAQIPVDGELVGKTLRQLNLRVRFGIHVYAIRHAEGETTAPTPDAKLSYGDVLLALGPEQEIEHLRAQSLEVETST